MREKQRVKKSNSQAYDKGIYDSVVAKKSGTCIVYLSFMHVD